ncbi:hypothetical protein C8Q80DRAFT_915776 [Daedaleopsis nitida]|nr:hypothetical protein C8Q80DRAFT_915776 [Daedaleopsis nitida]
MARPVVGPRWYLKVAPPSEIRILDALLSSCFGHASATIGAHLVHHASALAPTLSTLPSPTMDQFDNPFSSLESTWDDGLPGGVPVDEDAPSRAGVYCVIA